MSQPQIITTLLKIMEENQYKATIISRLAYAPMAVKNYGFGALTPVRPWAPIALAHLSN
jgi:hypothetical protein